MRLVKRDGKLKLVFGEKETVLERRLAAPTTDTEKIAANLKEMIDKHLESRKSTSWFDHGGMVSAVVGFIITLVLITAVVIPTLNNVSNSLESMNTTSTVNAPTVKTILGMAPLMIAIAVLLGCVNLVLK